MFSATFPRAVMRIAESFLDKPVMLKVGRVGGAASSVTQKVMYVDGREKTRTCVELLKSIPGKTIVFVNTKRSADTLEADLYDLGCPSASIHGDKDQRERALGDFKSGRISVIIGTDVLGRGIDVPAVTHVINYDAPGDIEDYTHRIGRTGRAGHQAPRTSLSSRPVPRPSLSPAAPHLAPLSPAAPHLASLSPAAPHLASLSPAAPSLAVAARCCRPRRPRHATALAAGPR